VRRSPFCLVCVSEQSSTTLLPRFEFAAWNSWVGGCQQLGNLGMTDCDNAVGSTESPTLLSCSAGGPAWPNERKEGRDEGRGLAFQRASEEADAREDGWEKSKERTPTSGLPIANGGKTPTQGSPSLVPISAANKPWGRVECSRRPCMAWKWTTVQSVAYYLAVHRWRRDRKAGSMGLFQMGLSTGIISIDSH